MPQSNSLQQINLYIKDASFPSLIIPKNISDLKLDINESEFRQNQIASNQIFRSGLISYQENQFKQRNYSVQLQKTPSYQKNFESVNLESLFKTSSTNIDIFYQKKVQTIQKQEDEKVEARKAGIAELFKYLEDNKKTQKQKEQSPNSNLQQVSQQIIFDKSHLQSKINTPEFQTYTSTIRSPGSIQITDFADDFVSAQYLPKIKINKEVDKKNIFGPKIQNSVKQNPNRERLLDFKEKQHEQNLQKIKQTQIPKIQRIRMEEESSQRLYRARMIEKMSLDKHRKLCESLIEKKIFKTSIEEEPTGGGDEPEFGRVSQLIARNLNEDYQPTPINRTPVPNDQDDQNSAKINQDQQEEIKKKLKAKIVKKMNQQIVTQSSAFIKIREDPSQTSPGIKNTTIHTGEWGKTSLTDQINQFTGDFVSNMKIKKQKPLLEQKRFTKHVTEENFKDLSAKLQKSLNKQQMKKLTGFGPDILGSASGLMQGDIFEAVPELLNYDRNKQIKVGTKSGETSATASEEEVTVDDIQNYSASVSTFERHYPEFKTGITPANDKLSEMDTKEKSEYFKKEAKQKIYKKKDFDMINRRQKMFKELADALKPEFQQKLLEKMPQVDYQLSKDEIKEFEIHKYLMQSEKFAQNSDIVKMDTNTFSDKVDAFPYSNQAKGLGVKAYNEKKKVFITSPKSVDSSKMSSLDQKKQIEIEDFKQLILDRKKFEKETMADILNYFFQYIQIEPFEENISQIFNLLSETYLTKAIMDSETFKNNPSLQAFLTNIQNKNKFFEKVKQYQGKPKAQEQLRKDDADIQFFQTCQEANQPTFSLLQKIKNKSLHLLGYRLDEIICKAFENSVQFQPDLLCECLLDSNGLKDIGLSFFIKGLSQMKIIRKLIIKNNDFGQKSFESIKKIILREKPHHLEELRLTDCKQSSLMTNKILELLNLGDKFTEPERHIDSDEEYSDEEKKNQEVKIDKFINPSVCVLRKLGLVNANISQECILNLVHLLKTSRFLTDLDLSYNELSCRSLILLVDEIKNNRRLQNLNLSWNRFKIKKGITKQFKEEVDRKMDHDEQKIIDGLCEFIKHNPKLLHLDLSYAGLTKLMLIEFGPALRKSKSMITLHLTGNPGIDQDLIDQIQERAHCRPQIPVLNIEQFNPPINLQTKKQKNKQFLNNQYGQLQGGLQIRQFKEDMLRRDDGRLERGFSLAEDKILIFQRILGHKRDMPGSGQWKQILFGNQKCWVCHNFVYSIIIWSVAIGRRYLEINNKGIADDDFISKIQILQERMEEQVKQQRDLDRSHKDYYNVKYGKELYSQGTPIIQGQFTNWHPEKMIPLEDFCLEIDTDAPNFFERMKNKKQCRDTCESPEDFDEKEKRIFEYYRFEHKQEYRENWQQIFQDYLPYKKPFLINQELVSNEELKLGPNGKLIRPAISEQNSTKTALKNHTSMMSSVSTLTKKQEIQPYDLPLISPIEQDHQVFIYPCLMKPAKNSYIIRYDPIPQNVRIQKMQDTSDKKKEVSETSSLQTDYDETSQYFTHMVMTPFRDEDIPINVKTYGMKKIVQVFQKNNSVFRDWREDNQERLEQAVEHDLTYWKARKFIKKDHDDFLGVENLVKKHFQLFKAVHTYYASFSNFPYLLPFEFSQFIHKFGIQNKDLPFQQIDTNFIASYSSMGKLQGCADNMLLRLQFIECLTRCAASKYKDSGKAKTYTEALEMMIENEIIPHSKDIWDEWHNFRVKKLWTKEVNELFKANFQNCTKLMEHFFQPRQKYLDVKDAIAIFTKHSEIITEKEANFCYGMSKMPNPIETKDIIKHRQITNVTELMEMIARVAETKYKSIHLVKQSEEKNKNENLSLDKIEKDDEISNQNDEHEEKIEVSNDIPLIEKIELVMDKVFQLIGCRTIIPVFGGEKDQSQSDEDY